MILFQGTTGHLLSSVAQSGPNLCDLVYCSTPGLPVHHQLLELAQTPVHRVSDAIQPSHPLSLSSPPALNLSQHQGLFQWVSSSHQVTKLLEFQLLPMNIQDLFPLGWTGWISLQSRDPQESSPTAQFKSICSSVLSFPYNPTFMTTGKTIALTRQTFVGKVMSLLFNMLSRLIIAFLPRSNCLLISRLQSQSVVILEPKKIKSATVFLCFPIYLPWSDGTGCHDLGFLNVDFKPTFSLCSFSFIKKLFSSSSLSAIRVVSSAYLRFFIFLLAILIPACTLSSLAFCMIYSAYTLNKQGDNIQPWHTPFPIWNQSVVPCPALTVTSWPAYRFLRRQVRWSGMPISWRIFQFVVIHIVKGFGIVNKAK